MRLADVPRFLGESLSCPFALFPGAHAAVVHSLLMDAAGQARAMNRQPFASSCSDDGDRVCRGSTYFITTLPGGTSCSGPCSAGSVVLPSQERRNIELRARVGVHVKAHHVVGGRVPHRLCTGRTYRGHAHRTLAVEGTLRAVPGGSGKRQIERRTACN